MSWRTIIPGDASTLPTEDDSDGLGRVVVMHALAQMPPSFEEWQVVGSNTGGYFIARMPIPAYVSAACEVPHE